MDQSTKGDVRTPGFNTLAIHAGAQPDPTTGARATPIYQTTSFVFDDVDHAAALFGLQTFGNICSRITNPTCAVLEERVAALEGGTAALAVASGHAAQVVAFHNLLKPGDEFIASKKLYGGSINQFNHAFKNFGWNVVWADPDDIKSFESAVSPKTKAIFIESIANPGGVITDIEAVGNVARRAGVPLIVDNTLATPYLCKPFEHGADIVVHSATKFLGGHGNSIGGVIVDGGSFNWSREGRYPMLSDPRPEYSGIILHETFGNFAFAIACRVLGLRDIGPALSPFNAFLILTGIETLPLRMQRHCDNALKAAEYLASHKQVAWVSYPGLNGDRYNQLAKPARSSSIRLRPPTASFPTCRRSRPAPGPTWCGSRSGSRIPRTSSPISTRGSRLKFAADENRSRGAAPNSAQISRLDNIAACDFGSACKRSSSRRVSRSRSTIATGRPAPCARCAPGPTTVSRKARPNAFFRACTNRICSRSATSPRARTIRWARRSTSRWCRCRGRRPPLSILRRITAPASRPLPRAHPTIRSTWAPASIASTSRATPRHGILMPRQSARGRCS